MHPSKLSILSAGMLLVLASCINPFVPEIEQSDEIKLVIGGGITAGKEEQIVNISLSSPVTDPEYVGLTSCNVTIMDDLGNEFLMQDLGTLIFQLPACRF